MVDCDIERDIAALLEHGACADTFAYSPELGARLRFQHPLWWDRYQHAQGGRWAPAQARYQSFMRWLGDTLPSDTLAGAIAREIAREPTWRRELTHSLIHETRVWPSEPAVPPRGSTLTSSRIGLYAPDICRDAIGARPESAWALGECAGLVMMPSRPAPLGALTRVHPRGFLSELRDWCAAGGGAMDPETHLDELSFARARAGSGAMLQAVGDVGRGLLSHALCLAKPGSHHAGPMRPMGTCVINHLAVGALEARALGLQVAIVDIDAHHGNGTEQIMLGHPEVLTLSLHQADLYPGTAALPSPGANIVNLDLRGPEDLAVVWPRALAALDAHRPDLILVELSMDAHHQDPISTLGWTDGDFARLMGDLARRARCVCEIGAASTEAAFRGGLRGALSGLGAS